MIGDGDYDDDAHFCLKCHITILGLDNYVSHRKAGCSKNLADPPKSPLPSQLLPPDESFGLKADDFFFSLELRSSSKKDAVQSTSGKSSSGILTRSKTTAVIQATSGTSKDAGEIQQSKSGKNVWIGGHQLKELGHGDNQSKLIKAVANLERRKEEVRKVEVFEDSDDDSEEYYYDVDESSDEDQDVPPRHYTGGKWKPSSPIQWPRNADVRDWNVPPPSYTGGKWKPSNKRSSSPPASHTKGKWKPSYNPQKEDFDVPPPTFTGSKWVSSKKQDYQDISPSVKERCKSRVDGDDEFPPPNYTKGKWKPKSQMEDETPPSSYTKGKWKPKGDNDDDFPPPNHTKGKWKPKNDNEDDVPSSSYTKGKWKPKNENDDDFPPPNYTKGKWKPRNDAEDDFPVPSIAKGKCKPKADNNEDDFPPPNHTKGKWKPKNDTIIDFPPPTHTKGKWKPKNFDIEPPQPSTSKQVETNKPLSDKDNNESKNVTVKIKDEKYDKKKLIPMTQNRSIFKISNESALRKFGGVTQYWCSPCNRKLASKIVYERHLKSELHFKRTVHDREFDDNDDLNVLKDARRTKVKPPESIFSNQEKNVTDLTKKRKRKKIFIRCAVCQSKVNKYLIGKHLISHYHCRKGDITTPVARAMVLENIYGVILECPFQCSICKFYCNTHDDFLIHWLSNDHVQKEAPGYFFCSLCKFRSEDTQLMYTHLVSPEHKEVVSVINRSVPIVIKKINPVYCPTCNKEFTLKMQLLNHCKRFNHDDTFAKTFKNEYICEPCGEAFLSSIALQRHRQNVHRDKYFVCTPCNLKFNNADEAKMHRRSLQHKYSCMSKSDQEKGAKKRSCEHCQESFTNFLLLKEHLKEKHPEHKIRCPHCGANFTITQELTSHLRSKSCKFEENPDDPFRCEQCPFTSSSTSELIFHVALHSDPLVTYPPGKDEDDPKVKPTFRYKCPICTKIYPKSSLQGHIRLHTQDRPFVCKICDAKFARKNNLQFHVKNHLKKDVLKIVKQPGERPYLCSACGANFKKKSVLQQHMQIHTGKRCKCPIPGCIFTGRKMSEIKEHLKTHSDVKNFSCNICEYKGKTKQHLNRHITIHEEIKKYQCPQCPFTTRNSTHLTRHTRLHTGAKPFSCPYCAYKCNNLENLRKHILSTNKHPGKCIYECKFCPENRFQTNLARDFKVHLVTCHPKIFGNGAEAASFVAGIYEAQDDKTFSTATPTSDMDQTNEGNIDAQSDKIDDASEDIMNLQTDDDPIVSQMSTVQHTELPMFVIPKEETVIVEDSPEAWNLVGRYDVEEESGTLIPFQSAGVDFFENNFE